MAGEVAHVARALRARADDLEREAEGIRNVLEQASLVRIMEQFRKLADQLENPAN